MGSPGCRRSARSVPPPPCDGGSLCARMVRTSSMWHVLLRGVRGVLCRALYMIALASPWAVLHDSWTCVPAVRVFGAPV